MKVAKTFFTKKEQEFIVETIREAEKNTSGEILVHIDNFCFGNAMKCAHKVFTKLKMHHTKERNGVLIYIAVFHKKIAIIGDEGIHQKLGKVYWNELIQRLITQFKANKKGEGLTEIILECGKQLGRFFPRVNKTNELKDTIDY